MSCSNFDNVSVLELVDTIANTIIALFALVFSIYIYYFTTKKDRINEEKNRKTDSLKTIILELNLKNLFLFYENVRNIVKPLLEKNHSDDEKKIINDRLQIELKELRLDFTDLLLAVDKRLYNDVKSCSDLLIDELTDTMFNDGVNLTNRLKFEQDIVEKISISKTNIIRILYEFNQ